MSFTLRCDSCSNDIDMFDIVDTGRKLRVHPGSVQRYMEPLYKGDCISQQNRLENLNQRYLRR